MEIRKPASVTAEILGDRGEIKKLFLTYLHTWINIKAVVDSYYEGHHYYTKPFKYALTIIAPYVLILNIADFDVAKVFLENSQPLAADTPAEMLPFLNRYNQVYSVWTNLLFVEFLPVFYAAVFAPLMAFFLSRFFKSGLGFNYYYALSLYTLMSICTVSFLLFFIGVAGDFNLNVFISLGSLFTVAIFTCSMNIIFRQGWIKSTLKMILVFFLSQIAFVVPMVIIISLVAYYTM